MASSPRPTTPTAIADVELTTAAVGETPTPLSQVPSPMGIGLPSDEDLSASPGFGMETRQPSPSPPQAPEDEPSGGDAEPRARHIIPEVRRTNYEGFKNYYSESESCYAIEVLEGGLRIKSEIALEKMRPGRPDRGGRWKNTMLSGRATGPCSDEVWIQRVRIQSRFILAHLRKVTDQSWNTETPLTFFRPFSAFMQYQPHMKEVLARLKATWPPEDDDVLTNGEREPEAEPAAATDDAWLDLISSEGQGYRTRRRADSDTSSDTHTGSTSTPEADVVPDSVLSSPETLKHIQCYVDFVDKHIMPLKDMFKGTSRQRVKYCDLYYLFRAGDVVYSPSRSEHIGPDYGPSDSSHAGSQKAWKISYANPPSIENNPPDDYDDCHRFYIECYYIDYDGENYGPVEHTFNIPPYEGERDIRHLVVYPIRYLADAKVFQQQLKKTNQDFQFFLSQKHLYYRGWSLTTSPIGAQLEDSEGKTVIHPAHIDSHVIVDFKAALQTLPRWKPPFREPSSNNETWRGGSDEGMPVIQWLDCKRTKCVMRYIEAVQRRDGVDAQQSNVYMDTDPFLQAFSKGNAGVGYELSEDDLMLLPGRVIAYVLRERKFVQLDTRYLSKIQKQSNVFDNLKIDEHHKEMVLALVDSHFRKKMNKDPQEHSLGQDLIQGKGEGLVILLHGVPGVGKTATAEAVAQSNDKPLFVITCGDLGFTPKEVESSLEGIFRLAHLWDCILLLDEADIFLAERTKDDLQRNALVSVFLRTLEYYGGILFLTTNRVGTLDEAFKSRIHMSLYYPPLNREQTLQIFEMNIQRIEDIEKQKIEDRKKAEAGPPTVADISKGQTVDPPLQINRPMIMKFARHHFDKHSFGTGRWNGRQIRNAFQIASSIAFYDMRKDWLARCKDDPRAVPKPPMLSHLQFIKFAKATLKFETYMNDARGGDDQDRARIAHTRADGYMAYENPASLPQQPPPPPPPQQQQRRQRSRGQVDPSQHGGRFTYGTAPTSWSDRRQSTRRDDPINYERDFESTSYGGFDRENSYDDPYGMEDGYDGEGRQTPTRSERSFGDDLDCDFDTPDQGQRSQNAGYGDQNQTYKDKSQIYRDSNQGYNRDQTQKRGLRNNDPSSRRDQDQTRNLRPGSSQSSHLGNRRSNQPQGMNNFDEY